MTRGAGRASVPLSQLARTALPASSAKRRTANRTDPALLESSRRLDGGYGDAVPKKPLNKNSARGLRTRQKLIDATIEALYTHGYHRTTTILVAEKAGVSRGSMLNQFPSKTDLMVAVAEYIARDRGRAHAKGQEGATSFEEKFERLVPILWNEFKGPSGVARLELMLASRSDPELAAQFEPLNDLLEDAHRKLVWALAKELGLESRELSDAAVHLYAAALRGLSIDLLFPGRETTIEDAAALLKAFMTSLIDGQHVYGRALEARRVEERTKLRPRVVEGRRPGFNSGPVRRKIADSR